MAESAAWIWPLCLFLLHKRMKEWCANFIQDGNGCIMFIMYTKLRLFARREHANTELDKTPE